MLDELLNDRRPDFLHESHQKEIIAQFCNGLDARLRGAASRDEATALVEASCRGFEQSCPSSLVRKFLVSYAHSLLDRHWDTRS